MSAALPELVEALVAGGAVDGALRDGIGAALRGRDCAQLLRDLRDDADLNFVIYEVPRDVCSKPREMLAWLLERLVLELRDER